MKPVIITQPQWLEIRSKLKEEYPLGKNIKKNVTIQEEITIFWADVDFFRLYN
jgi:hypothetical protein